MNTANTINIDTVPRCALSPPLLGLRMCGLDYPINRPSENFNRLQNELGFIWVGPEPQDGAKLAPNTLNKKQY